jgi:hypothetical protein
VHVIAFRKVELLLNLKTMKSEFMSKIQIGQSDFIPNGNDRSIAEVIYGFNTGLNTVNQGLALKDIELRSENLGKFYENIPVAGGIIGNTEKASYKNNAQLGLALAVYLRRNPFFNSLNPDAQKAIAVAMISKLASQGRVSRPNATATGLETAYPILPKSNLGKIIRNGLDKGTYPQLNPNQVKLLSQVDGITPKATANIAANPVTPQLQQMRFRS